MDAKFSNASVADANIIGKLLHIPQGLVIIEVFALLVIFSLFPKLGELPQKASKLEQEITS